MTPSYYDYGSREGIKIISWQDFYGLCKGLALAASAYQPDMILGILRGGMYPATQISHLLRVDAYVIRLTRRQHDRVIHDDPQWVIKPPEEVKDQKILIVDEICSEGKTLQLAREEARRMGAKDIRCAVMYAHTWGQHLPDYIGLISDELIMNPWDREIVDAGTFILHPEYVHALQQQNLPIDDSLRVGVEAYPLAKG
ncbi:MAG: phosphoribosyltransferase [Anaerolineae bacterium]|nr:phosphoribosyltransferase [Anaerolineae bacterium]